MICMFDPYLAGEYVYLSLPPIIQRMTYTLQYIYNYGIYNFPRSDCCLKSSQSPAPNLSSSNFQLRKHPSDIAVPYPRPSRLYARFETREYNLPWEFSEIETLFPKIDKKKRNGSLSVPRKFHAGALTIQKIGIPYSSRDNTSRCKQIEFSRLPYMTRRGILMIRRIKGHCQTRWTWLFISNFVLPLHNADMYRLTDRGLHVCIYTYMPPTYKNIYAVYISTCTYMHPKDQPCSMLKIKKPCIRALHEARRSVRSRVVRPWMHPRRAPVSHLYTARTPRNALHHSRRCWMSANIYRGIGVPVWIYVDDVFRWIS